MAVYEPKLFDDKFWEVSGLLKISLILIVWVSSEPIFSFQTQEVLSTNILLHCFFDVLNRLFLLSLWSAFDKPAQITNWQVEREIDSSQQLHKEEVPSEKTNDKCACSSSDGESCVCSMSEEECCQQTKCWDQKQEDEEEDDVGSEWDDHVHETQNSHIDLEEGECAHECWVGGCCCQIVRLICSGGIEIWCQCCSEWQPESSECSKDNEWERVSQDEFEEGSQQHEKTTEEVIDTTVNCQPCSHDWKASLTSQRHQDHQHFAIPSTHWTEVSKKARILPKHYEVLVRSINNFMILTEVLDYQRSIECCSRPDSLEKDISSRTILVRLTDCLRSSISWEQSLHRDDRDEGHNRWFGYHWRRWHLYGLSQHQPFWRLLKIIKCQVLVISEIFMSNELESEQSNLMATIWNKDEDEMKADKRLYESSASDRPGFDCCRSWEETWSTGRWTDLNAQWKAWVDLSSKLVDTEIGSFAGWSGRMRSIGVKMIDQCGWNLLGKGCKECMMSRMAWGSFNHIWGWPGWSTNGVLTVSQ